MDFLEVINQLNSVFRTPVNTESLPSPAARETPAGPAFRAQKKSEKKVFEQIHINKPSKKNLYKEVKKIQLQTLNDSMGLVYLPTFGWFDSKCIGKEASSAPLGRHA